ncbi:energy transducer TonB [candidate division KSB1 bacterium]|nr:energy transducer TonB [candidate division KSB1 bacterium]
MHPGNADRKRPGALALTPPRVISNWRFTPAMQQGTPVGVWVVVPFKFRLGK